jgi:hypothetical protein
MRKSNWNDDDFPPTPDMKIIGRQSKEVFKHEDGNWYYKYQAFLRINQAVRLRGSYYEYLYIDLNSTISPFDKSPLIEGNYLEIKASTKHLLLPSRCAEEDVKMACEQPHTISIAIPDDNPDKPLMDFFGISQKDFNSQSGYWTATIALKKQQQGDVLRYEMIV